MPQDAVVVTVVSGTGSRDSPPWGSHLLIWWTIRAYSSHGSCKAASYEGDAGGTSSILGSELASFCFSLCAARQDKSQA